MYKKLSNLNVGDIFQYGDTIYENSRKKEYGMQNASILMKLLNRNIHLNIYL